MLELFIILYIIRVILCTLITLIFDKLELKETFMVNSAIQALIFILMPFYIPYLFWRIIENKFKQEGV